MYPSRTAAFSEILPDAAGAENPTVKPLRLARLPEFIGLERDANVVLGGLKIGVVGCGSVGARVAEHVSRLQVEQLLLIDHGSYKPESLLTQPIGPEDVGKPKGRVTGRRCRAISPDTSVYTFEDSVESLPLIAFAALDLVILATDNLLAELEVGRRCAALGVPLLFAAVHGESLTAQIRFYGNRGLQDSPCPACGLTANEWRQLNAQTSFACDGGAALDSVARVESLPTRSPSSLCSLAADFAVLQMLHFALGLGNDTQDTLVEYCSFRHSSVVSTLTRNHRCPAEHLAWSRKALDRSLGDYSLHDLAQAAERAAAGTPGLERCGEAASAQAAPQLRADLGGVAFAVDELGFVETGVCECDCTKQLLGFFRGGQTNQTCEHCSKPIRVLPFATHWRVPGSALGKRLDEPLKTFSQRVPRWVVVHEGNRATLFYPGNPQLGRCFDEDRSRESD